jgi:GH43 family beta-xylosidase
VLVFPLHAEAVGFAVVLSNWWVKDDVPVFKRSTTAFGPGHASFTTDRNGVPYIIYHATATADGGWAGRTIRAQTFGWNTDGTPAFPSPGGLGIALPLPA